jgi:hypothetical protein
MIHGFAPSERCDVEPARYFLLKEQKHASCDDGDCPMRACSRESIFANAILELLEPLDLSDKNSKTPYGYKKRLD